MSVSPKTGKRRRENDASMQIPISLEKASFRRRLEDYYSLIAPDTISIEKEWRRKFELIYDTYGGAAEKELTLAKKLAKKYGNTVQLQLTNESALPHLLNQQAEQTPAVRVPPSETKYVAIKAHKKDMSNVEANKRNKADQTTKSVSIIKPGTSLIACTSHIEEDLSVLASASVSAALPSKRKLKMMRKKAKREEELKTKKKEQEAALYLTTHPSVPLASKREEELKAKKKEQEAALYLTTHPSVPLASFSSLSPSSKKEHAEKINLEQTALCDASKRYDGHLFLKEYMLLIDSPIDQNPIPPYSNKRDVDIYSFSKVTETIRHSDGRKKRMETITNGVWQCAISLRAAFGYHQRNVQAKDLPIDDDNSFVISVKVPQIQNPENDKMVRWFCFLKHFFCYLLA